MKLFALVKPYLSRYKKKLFIFAFLDFILWGISLITPYFVGNFLDLLLSYRSVEIIWSIVFILSVCWTSQIVISYIRNILHTELQSKICFSINISLIKYLMKLPLKFFARTDASYLNQRISSDSNIITNFVIGEIFRIILTMLTLICSGAIIFSINSVVMIFISLILPLYILIYLKFQSLLYKLNYEYSEQCGKYYSTTDRLLNNIKSIKLHERQSEATENVKKSFDNFYKVMKKNAKVGYLFDNADSVVRYLANIIIFIYAGKQVLVDNISVGEFTMINSYGMMIISCISNILMFGKTYRYSTVAYDRISEIFNMNEEHCGDICIKNVFKITGNDLCFSYGDKKIINNLNFVFERGNIYSIVGENGAGKSTLVNILCGLEHTYTGIIKFNNTNLKQIDHHHLKKKLISVVEQEPTLFLSNTIINLSLSENKDKIINYWGNRMHIDDFISFFSKRINQYNSDSLINCSSGEKQKIATLSAIIKDTDVLILDEPSSALDKESVDCLCESLNSLKKNKIIIVITHDQKIIDRSDQIISL